MPPLFLFVSPFKILKSLKYPNLHKIYPHTPSSSSNLNFPLILLSSTTPPQHTIYDNPPLYSSFIYWVRSHLVFRKRGKLTEYHVRPILLCFSFIFNFSRFFLLFSVFFTVCHSLRTFMYGRLYL